MKKLTFIVSAFVFLMSFSVGFAHAAASPYFAYDPNTTNGGAVDLHLPWQGVNGPVPTSGDHYSRNVYFDFTKSPYATSGPLTESSNGATYFGVIDNENQKAAVVDADSVTWNGTGTQPTEFSSGDFGLKGGKSTSTGSTTFTLGNNLSLASNNFPMYYFVEADYNLVVGSSQAAGTANSIIFTLSSPAIASSEFFINGTKQTGSGDSYTISSTTTTSGIFDAWFEFSTFPTSEALNVAFTAQAGNNGGQQGGEAYITSLHIATTPEPMAMALFATGGVALLFFRRRRFSFQTA